MTQLPNPLQPAQQPAFFGSQQQPFAPQPMGGAVSPGFDPLQDALSIVNQIEGGQPQQPDAPASGGVSLQETVDFLQDFEAGRLEWQPPESGQLQHWQQFQDPMDIVDAIETRAKHQEDLVDQRQDQVLAARKAWWKSLPESRRKEIQLDAKRQVSFTEIDRLVEKRKGDPWYRDPHGNPRQHDPLSRMFRRVPFVGALASGGDLLAVKSSLKRVLDGNPSDDDLQRVAAFKTEMQYAEKDKGVIEKATDILSDLPAFAVEFVLTGGTYTAVKTGTKAALVRGAKSAAKKAMKEAFEKHMKSTAGSTVSAAVRKRAARKLARRVYRDAIEKEFARATADRFGRKALGSVGGRLLGAATQTLVNPQRLFEATSHELLSQQINGDEENLAKAIGRGTLRQYIEMGSERAGGLIGRTKLVEGMKRAMFARLIQKGWSPKRVSNRLKSAGFDGILNEIFEERVGEVLRAATGLEKFEVPGWDQLAAEAIAFSVPGGVNFLSSKGDLVKAKDAKRFLGELKRLQTQSKDAEKKTIIENLGDFALESAKDAALVHQLEGFDGRTPSRQEWKDLDLPQVRFTQDERKQVTDAILSAAVTQDLLDAKLGVRPARIKNRKVLEADIEPLDENEPTEKSGNLLPGFGATKGHPRSKLEQVVRDNAGDDPRDQETFRGAMQHAIRELEETIGSEGRGIDAGKSRLWGEDSSNHARWASQQRQLAKWLGEGKDSDFILQQFEVDENQLLDAMNSEAPGQFSDIDAALHLLSQDTPRLTETDDRVIEHAWGLLQGWEPGQAEVEDGRSSLDVEEPLPLERSLSHSETQLSPKAKPLSRRPRAKPLDAMWDYTDLPANSGKLGKSKPPVLSVDEYRKQLGEAPGSPHGPAAPPRSLLRPGRVFRDLAALENAPDAAVEPESAETRAAQSPPWPRTGIPRAQVVSPASKTKPISAHSVIATAEWLFQFRAKLDRMGREAGGTRGYFKVRDEFIRMRGRFAGDIALLSHELAHLIDKRYGVKDSLVALSHSDPDRFVSIMSELQGMDYKPEAARWYEGFAEWFRFYVTGMEDPHQAPLFMQWFLHDFAPKAKDAHDSRPGTLLEKTDRLVALAARWREQGATKRVGSDIRRNRDDFPDAELTRGERAKRWVLNRAETHYMLWKDESYQIAKISGELRRRGHEGITPYELMMAHSLAAPAHAEKALFDGVHTVGEGVQEKLSEGLFGYKDHVKKEEYEDWIQYIIAQHAIEAWDKGVMGEEYNPGVDIEEANVIVNAVSSDRAKQVRFDRAHQLLTDFNNALFEMLVQIPGKKTHGDLMRAKQKWEKYVPLMRVSKNKNTLLDRLTGSGFLNVGTPIKSRKKGGSGLPIQDPVISTVQRAIAFYSNALHQSVKWHMAKSMVPQLDGVEGMGDVMEWDVDPKVARTKFPVADAIKQLIDGGFVPEEHGQVLRAAHYWRAGDAGFKSMKSLAGYLGIGFPDAPSNLNQRQQGDVDKNGWPEDWSEAMPRHWNWLDEEVSESIEREIENRIDEIPDLMEMIAVYKPQFIPDQADFIEVMYVEGKPVLVQWDPDVYRTLDSLDNFQSGIMLNTFRQMNRLKKMGAIGVNTAFSVANFFRDYYTFQHQTKFSKGWWDSLSNPLAWVARYIGYMMRKANSKDFEMIGLWKEASGDLATRLGADADSIQRLQARVTNVTLADKIKHVILHPLQATVDATEWLRDWIGVTEVGPRLAEFERALNTSGFERRYDSASGKWRVYNTATDSFERPDRDTIVKAVNAANDVTVNFKRRGRLGKKVDAFVTFFNAALEGQDKQVRTVLEAFTRHASGTNPLDDKSRRKLTGRLVVALAASAAATIAYWLHRKDDDDYKAQSEWLQKGFWTFAPNGKPLIRIPRDHSWNALPVFTEAMLNDFAGPEDGRKHQVIKSFIHQLERRNPLGSPIDRGPMSFIGGTEIPIVKPTVEVLADYDMFRESAIEGPVLKHRKPGDRSTAHTGWMSKSIGRLVNKSPVKIDHWLTSSTGGLWHDIQNLTGGHVRDVRHPLKSLLVKRDYTDDIQDFYKRWEQLKQEVGSAELRGADATEIRQERNRFDNYVKIMTELRKPIRNIRDRDARFDREKYIIGLARHALGRPALKRYPNPLSSNVQLPDDISQAADAKLDDWVWTATGSSDTPARRNARSRLRAIGISQQKARVLIMQHGWAEHQGKRKSKKPLQRIQKPASMPVRMKRLQRLQFLGAE